jgi:8-oxo-dGTP diphosphatase
MLLVRHAWAGDSAAWTADDRVRPLDERGLRQAAALVDALAGYEVRRIVSSPYLRCVQTVEPLAAARGLEVELRSELGEDRDAVDGRAFLLELDGEPVVACVHGGARHLASGRVAEFAKGATLVLGPGLVPRAYLAPPA